jgi:DNA-binding XRE family transcriptional regulator
MGRSYEEAMEGRRGRVSPETKAQGEVLAGGYKLAVSFMNYRSERGLTQEQLAKRAGVTQADISRIERGAGNPTERTLLKVAEALGATIVLTNKEETGHRSTRVATALPHTVS